MRRSKASVNSVPLWFIIRIPYPETLFESTPERPGNQTLSAGISSLSLPARRLEGSSSRSLSAKIVVPIVVPACPPMWRGLRRQRSRRGSRRRWGKSTTIRTKIPPKADRQRQRESPKAQITFQRERPCASLCLCFPPGPVYVLRREDTRLGWYRIGFRGYERFNRRLFLLCRQFSFWSPRSVRD